MSLKRICQTALLALTLVTPALTGQASAQQTLKVGSTPTGIPFTFLDTKTNSIQGIMVDIVTEAGKRAGFQVQVEPMQFSTLIAALTSNKIDLISAAMYITPARKEQIDGVEYFVVARDVTMDSHPAYTGEKRLVDTAGRVEKFTTKFKRVTTKK